ncbi:maltose/maltodextrin ABC transporter [Gracilibacillus boraciitolerans JCM 21714]|uniref:Maltodextrin-binding protein n=1 Tax=Gracilibacillus boraciitolerans JCM 21714 TaxID=1298598 RepID=W4VKN6_9BACI|nr:extracellular solute-binding protein [Gracilibacillus boraciitolerans]GAE93393.1 maltose/maltodextrin ABC transporter [Gracilibacillus boraciitolerans JCM 21714]
MKKWLISLLAVLLIIGLLTACGPDEANESTEETDTQPEEQETEGRTEEETSMPEKPEKLTVWVNAEEKQEDAVNQIAAKYTEETGIEIEAVPIDMLEQVEKLDVEGPAGNGPDIIFQPHDRIGDLVLRGLIDPIDLGDSKGDFTEAAINAVTNEGGETWGGYPAVTETYALFYNKSLVAEAPATMEDLMAIAEEQTNAANDEYGFLMEAANFYFTYPFFSGNGAYVFAEENGSYDITDIGLNNEGAVEGGKLIQSWFENGYIPQDLTPDIMNGLFKEGKVATVINGPWMVREYQEALGDDLQAAILPKLDNGENPKSFVGGVKAYLLSYYSENKEWANDFMAYVTNSENAMLYYDVAGEMPARVDSIDDPAIADDPIYSAFAEQATYGEPMPGVPAMQQVWDPINNGLSFISKGEPVEAVLDEAVQTIKDNIAASGGATQ